MGKLIIEKPGLFTSVQDLGRVGHRRYGVPLSGVMDTFHGKLANLLVNNQINDAVLEITQIGPTIRWEGHCTAALAGADLSAHLDGKSLTPNTVFTAAPGQRLTFDHPKRGLRAYLAVKGGLLTTPIMGSRSMYAQLTGANLNSGDELSFEDHHKTISGYATVATPGDFFSDNTLEAHPGPDFSLLSPEFQHELRQTSWEVRAHSRMGYQLHANISENTLSIVTAPVVPGTVQLTPSGSLMVLTKDAQVTGGYPRILQLTEDSLNRLAHKTTKERLLLKII